MPTGVYNRPTRRLSTSRVRSTARDIGRTAAGTPGNGPTATQDETSPKESHKLTASVARLVDGIRTTFTAFVDDFTSFTLSGEELAPRFMRTYRKWEAETGGSFIAFVRLLVPSIPMDVKSYKAHSAYMSADYLRREAARLERQGTTPAERAEAIRNRPVSPRTALARVLASVMPLIDPNALETLFEAMRSNLHWSEAQVDGIKELVGEETPLVRIRAPRGVHIEQGLKLSPAPVVADDAAATA